MASDLFITLEILFTFGVMYLVGGALIGKFVIEPAIKRMTGTEILAESSSQERLKLLEEYRQRQERTGRSRFFYWYIYIGYRYGKYYLLLMFLIFLVVILKVVNFIP